MLVCLKERKMALLYIRNYQRRAFQVSNIESGKVTVRSDP